jgi:hypothetical protein
MSLRPLSADKVTDSRPDDTARHEATTRDQHRAGRHRRRPPCRSVRVGPPAASDHLGADTHEQPVDGAGCLPPGRAALGSAVRAGEVPPEDEDGLDQR